jgi:hypothetical protein
MSHAPVLLHCSPFSLCVCICLPGCVQYYSYIIPSDSPSRTSWGVGWYTLNSNSSLFANNTFVSFKTAAQGGTQFHYVWSLPSAAADVSVTGTRYLFAADDSMTFLVGGSGTMNPTGVAPPAFAPSEVRTLAQWQKLTATDAGATASADATVDSTVAMARQLLQLAG